MEGSGASGSSRTREVRVGGFRSLSRTGGTRSASRSGEAEVARGKSFRVRVRVENEAAREEFPEEERRPESCEWLSFRPTEIERSRSLEPPPTCAYTPHGEHRLSLRRSFSLTVVCSPRPLLDTFLLAPSLDSSAPTSPFDHPPPPPVQSALLSHLPP